MAYTEPQHTAPAKISIGGAYRVGKSSRLDELEDQDPIHFERGEKFKKREEGAWASDSALSASAQTELINPVLRQMRLEEFEETQRRPASKRKDSIYVTPAELQQLRDQGKIAFRYRSWDTLHAIGAADALRTDKHIVYIDDTMRGSIAYSNYFNPLITFLLYTDPKVIEKRLKAARNPPDKIPEKTLAQRLHFFNQEQAFYLQKAYRFHFPMYTRSDEPVDTGLTGEELAAWNHAQIYQDTERMRDLVNVFNAFYKPGMTVQNLHDAYIDNLLRSLLDTGLDGLRARRGAARLDLSEQFAEYRRYREIIPRRLQTIVGSLYATYQQANGRHNLLIYRIADGRPTGVSDPANEKGAYRASESPEEILMELILQRLGIKPTVEFRIYGTGLHNETNFGQMNIVHAMLRNGAFISLGDPLPNVTTHASLNIAFAYPQNGRLPRGIPYEQDQISRIPISYTRPTPEQGGNIGSATKVS